MELVNTTPFVPFQFESVDQNLNHFGVVVLRGTFNLKNNKRMELSPKQESLLLKDEYFGDAGCSSMRFGNSLAPYKPKTDVLVEATAYSPSGIPEPEWISSFRVGPIDKNFRVTGPREWTRRIGGTRLSEFEPIERLEVRYEHAFGGEIGLEDNSRFASNPVGVGFGASHRTSNLCCPQILPLEVADPSIGQPLKPEGLGPIAPSWEPRTRHSGTLDTSWEAKHAPYLPKDFSFEFHNASSPDLRFPGFAKGDEQFELINLSKDRELRFGLPGIEMISLIEFKDGRVIPAPINLDTIQLQIEDQKAFLEWRGIFPLQIPIRGIEIRMSAPEYMIES